MSVMWREPFDCKWNGSPTIGFPSVPYHVRSGGGIPTARHGRRTEPRLRTEIASPNEMIPAATEEKEALSKFTFQLCKKKRILSWCTMKTLPNTYMTYCNRKLDMKETWYNIKCTSIIDGGVNYRRTLPLAHLCRCCYPKFISFTFMKVMHLIMGVQWWNMSLHQVSFLTGLQDTPIYTVACKLAICTQWF